MRFKHMAARSIRVTILTSLILPISIGLGQHDAMAAASGVRTVSYGGASLSVPTSWPVYNLQTDPLRCALLNVHAVYLGHEQSQARCPAHALGRTDAVRIEPNDSSVVAAARRATTRVNINGHAVHLNASSDVTHEVVAVIDDAGLLVSITYGTSPGLARQILASLVINSPGRVNQGATSPALRPATAAPALRVSAAAGPYTGGGFDTCGAPSTSAMQSWLNSPYRAVGIYIGGANRACPDGNLSASWITSVEGMGWNPIPIYVGLQAPCTSGFYTIDPGSASGEGVQAADDAVSDAATFGLAQGRVIFFDMEAYTTGGTCTSTVMAFLAAWSSELHAKGYASGVYGSLNSTISDLVATPSAHPDEIWFARWDGSATTSDPSIPSSDWASHQRIKQYQGGHNETYGGVTIDIDNDYLDATLIPGTPVSNLEPANGYSSVLVNTDGHLEAFFRQTDGNVYHSWGPSWSGWYLLASGPQMQTAPEVVLNNGGTGEAFAVGTDGNLYHTWQPSWGTWYAISSLPTGVTFSGQPSVARTADWGVAVVVRGSDNAYWWTMRHGSAWTAWASLGGTFASDPTLIQNAGDGHLEVFGRSGTSIEHDYQSNFDWTWSGWSALGSGSFASRVAVARNASGPIEIFDVGTDGQLYHQYQTPGQGTGWSGWWALGAPPIGGAWQGSPSVTANPNGALEVFARGPDGAIWHAWQPNWNPWASLGGAMGSDPIALLESAPYVDVWGIGAQDHQAYEQWRGGDAVWVGWQARGGNIQVP